uniref:Heterochromatin protein 1-binding protein 3 n=1 Tax=Mola mola TaxID=94237 RepID=A0A3Q3WIS6_MOLML
MGLAVSPFLATLVHKVGLEPAPSPVCCLPPSPPSVCLHMCSLHLAGKFRVMPIRRAAATPSQEKAPLAARPVNATPSQTHVPLWCPAGPDRQQTAALGFSGAPRSTNNTCQLNNELLNQLKDGYKYEKTKAKKVKRTIPAWASVAASKKVPVTNFAGTQHKVDDVLIEALESCNTRSGVSYQSVLKFIVKKYPGMELDKKKFLIKKAMKKHLEKGTIKQLKGKGLSGTFAIGKKPKAAQKTESLGDALPLIITRLCEPKEASYNLIKKYLEQHFPGLNIENKPEVLKTALVKAVERGQLEQITGKGARGTFQNNGNILLSLTIISAITAMNEPKTCSTTTLRKYLVDANKDRKEGAFEKLAHLRRTLTKCKVLGWMEQITGHGFTGTYRLSFPFYPSPTILYPDKFKQLQKTNTSPPPKRKRAANSSDEEDDEDEEEEEESEDEAPSRKRSSRSASQSKAKRRGRSLAKKSPAKKASTAILSARMKKVKESSPPSPKATPVKRGAPARKPKTPAVKKLSKRGAKRPSKAPEDAADTTKTGSKRTKAEESNEEPAAKKPATKSGSRRPEPDGSSPGEPAAKKQAKSSKQSTRKSKRGKN